MIMTAGIGMADKVNKFHFGVTCNTRSAKEIHSAILKLKEDKSLWNLSHKSELDAAGQYSWENAVKVLVPIYMGRG